jgi:hypothetical protein
MHDLGDRGSGNMTYSAPGYHNSTPRIDGVPCHSFDPTECLGLQQATGQG